MPAPWPQAVRADRSPSTARSDLTVSGADSGSLRIAPFVIHFPIHLFVKQHRFAMDSRCSLPSIRSGAGMTAFHLACRLSTAEANPKPNPSPPRPRRFRTSPDARKQGTHDGWRIETLSASSDRMMRRWDALVASFAGIRPQLLLLMSLSRRMTSASGLWYVPVFWPSARKLVDRAATWCLAFHSSTAARGTRRWPPAETVAPSRRF